MHLVMWCLFTIARTSNVLCFCCADNNMKGACSCTAAHEPQLQFQKAVASRLCDQLLVVQEQVQ
jgi:hypothetical protein